MQYVVLSFKGGCGDNAGTGIQSYVTRQTPGNYVLSAVFEESEKNVKF